MKIVLLVGISFFTIGISSWAQQKALSKPSVVVLLTRLQSQSDVERSEAFEALRSNPAALKSPEVRAALLDLLDRENRERDAKLLRSLDPRKALAVRQIVLGALQDRDEGVRAFAVNALRSYVGKDMVTALRRVAETEPSPEVEGSSIRKAAAEAIAAIQKLTVGKGGPQVHPQR